MTNRTSFGRPCLTSWRVLQEKLLLLLRASGPGSGRRSLLSTCDELLLPQRLKRSSNDSSGGSMRSRIMKTQIVDMPKKNPNSRSGLIALTRLVKKLTRVEPLVAKQLIALCPIVRTKRFSDRSSCSPLCFQKPWKTKTMSHPTPSIRNTLKNETTCMDSIGETLYAMGTDIRMSKRQLKLMNMLFICTHMYVEAKHMEPRTIFMSSSTTSKISALSRSLSSLKYTFV
mmetsp:Transcript_14899/g.31182  ORF Transcript_14899/g.31182 Transcript_14899/m.31182 type:complete len:228 (-) Transcript_14899:17-700(-)